MKKIDLIYIIILKISTFIFVIRDFNSNILFNLISIFIIIILSIFYFLKKNYKVILFIDSIFSLIIFIKAFNGIYYNVPFWDTLMHSLTGFFMVILVIIIYRYKKIILSKFVIILLSFCFSLTVGTMFEIYEYTMDKIFKYDMQKDMVINNIYTTKFDKDEKKIKKIENINEMVVYYNNQKIVINGYLDIGINDTMKDLIVNLFGSIMGCFYFYYYLKYN